jgi:hypothetical protein
MNEKKYVGSGKKVGNYDLINFTISEEKTKTLGLSTMVSVFKVVYCLKKNS